MVPQVLTATFKDAQNNSGELHVIGHIDKQKDMVYGRDKGC